MIVCAHPRFLVTSVQLSHQATRDLLAEEIEFAIQRLAYGDWGDVSPELAGQNDRHLRTDGDLYGLYRSRGERMIEARAKRFSSIGYGVGIQIKGEA